MRYFDTSFLAPLFLSESTSGAIHPFFASIKAEQLAISHWTRVEFSSLLALKLRMGNLDTRAARGAEIRFEEAAAQSFVVFLPEVADFDLAKTYLRRPETGLRGGDALHLAIARNRDVETIHTFDKKLLKAGAMLGLPVSAELR